MPVTATITENQAIRMHQLTRRLCVALREMEGHVHSLLGVNHHKDLHEAECIPVLLDLADESAQELLDLAKTIDAEF